MGLAHKSTIFSNGTPISRTSKVGITYSSIIPANTFDLNGGVIDLTVRTQKEGTSDSFNIYVYVNNSESLAGASLIAKWFVNTATQYYEGLRTFAVYNNIIKHITVTSLNRFTDDIFIGNAEETNIFNNEEDIYIIVALNLTNGVFTDTVYGSFVNILCYIDG